ncbi:hypothetical protein T265_09968 [Opisthorchis viverrini]|uniref:Uncharacterized protein n=1 Tax=Opisthorchis viverrini TaxID=6198 RepID=A0A074Z409_OPIVI|nr:hypothetical protein T265_09968 [Opisthorchis viverrini]KER21783.1 hypothetical protein T265_09968 [Opisthorchis viverrini]
MFTILYIAVYAIVYISQAASFLPVNPVQPLRQDRSNANARTPVVGDTRLPVPNDDHGNVSLRDSHQERRKDEFKMQSSRSLSNTGVQASSPNDQVSVSNVDITGNTTQETSLHEVEPQKIIQKLGAEPVEQPDEQIHAGSLGGKELVNQSVDNKPNAVQNQPLLQPSINNSDVGTQNIKPTPTKLPSGKNATSVTETGGSFKVLGVKPTWVPKEPVKNIEWKSGKHGESYQAPQLPEDSFTNDNLRGMTELSKASGNLETQVKQNPFTEKVLSSLGLAMEAAKAKQKSPANQMSDDNVREPGISDEDDVGGEPEKNNLKNLDVLNSQLSKLPKATIESVRRAEDDPEISQSVFNVPSVPIEYVLLSICVLCVIVLLLWKRCWYVICTVCCKRRQQPIGNVTGRYKVTYKPL